MRKAAMMPAATLALLLAGAAGLGACSSQKSADTEAKPLAAAAAAVKPADKAVPDALDDTDGMQTVAEALKETGLKSVFEGKGSYTLLAPEDASFEKLGDAGKALTGGPDHAALAALLKDHIVPGYLTPDDIGAAIAASKKGSVEMTTMGGTRLTFSKAGDGIRIAAPDGATATIDGAPVAGKASSALPIQGVLKTV